MMNAVFLLRCTLQLLSPTLKVKAAMDILETISGMLMRDCPWSNSGNAALAAAEVFKVPDRERAQFIKASSALFTSNDDIRNKRDTPAIAFTNWLERATHDPFLSQYLKNDNRAVPQLVDAMMRVDDELKGPDHCNVALCELVRWVAKGVPRPQWASIFLIAVERGVLNESVPLPAGWLDGMHAAAKKTQSMAFFVAGQNINGPPEPWTPRVAWSRHYKAGMFDFVPKLIAHNNARRAHVAERQALMAGQETVPLPPASAAQPKKRTRVEGETPHGAEGYAAMETCPRCNMDLSDRGPIRSQRHVKNCTARGTL